VGASGTGAAAHAKDGKIHDKAKAAAMHRGEEGQVKRRKQMTAEFGDGGIAGGKNKMLRGPTVGKKKHRK
jgi:hypothetical protein